MICNIYYIAVCFLLIRLVSHSRVRFTRLTYSTRSIVVLLFWFTSSIYSWLQTIDTHGGSYCSYGAQTRTQSRWEGKENLRFMCECVMCLWLYAENTLSICVFFCLLNLFCFHSFLSFFVWLDAAGCWLPLSVLLLLLRFICGAFCLGRAQCAHCVRSSHIHSQLTCDSMCGFLYLRYFGTSVYSFSRWFIAFNQFRFVFHATR